MSKRVLTIQDISCVGQCSLTVALPVISATGIETCVLPSAVLSTHTGGKFTNFTFRDLTEDIPKINKSWLESNQKFDYIYTGYIGSAKQIDYIEDIINSCLNENGQVIIDPVMGDLGKFYSGFDMNYAKKMRGFCGKADIIMPNLTEASFLLDIPYIGENFNKSYIDEILIKLSNLGAKKVVLTGVSFNKDELGVAIYDTTSKSTNYCFNKKINKSFHGTGDLFASSLVGAIANDVHILEAVKIATEFVFEAISATMENYDTDHWYGVRFEKALPYLMRKLNK